MIMKIIRIRPIEPSPMENYINSGRNLAVVVESCFELEYMIKYDKENTIFYFQLLVIIE